MDNVVALNPSKDAEHYADASGKKYDLCQMIALPGVDLHFQSELVRVLRLLGDQHVLDNFNRPSVSCGN